jgi:hypothetical protein
MIGWQEFFQLGHREQAFLHLIASAHHIPSNALNSVSVMTGLQTTVYMGLNFNRLLETSSFAL